MERGVRDKTLFCGMNKPTSRLMLLAAIPQRWVFFSPALHRDAQQMLQLTPCDALHEELSH